MKHFQKTASVVRRTLTKISPMLNTRVLYFFKFHRRLNLNKPETLNEKILWLKYHNYRNNELVRQCADKYRVREYVESIGCGELLNELYGAWKTPEEIDWEKLPERFVLKLNTACGFNRIVLDKSSEDMALLNMELHRWLKEAPKYWLGYAEMQYKDVEPLILAEKYLSGTDGILPEDYKFYCFNGKAEYVMVCADRELGKKAAYFYFDRNWKMMPFSEDYFRNPDRVVPRPPLIDEAFRAAEQLSREFPFVRTDLYIVEDRIVFGELTFTPSAGLDQGRRPETDRLLGEMLQLPGLEAGG